LALIQAGRHHKGSEAGSAEVDPDGTVSDATDADVFDPDGTDPDGMDPDGFDLGGTYPNGLDPDGTNPGVFDADEIALEARDSVGIDPIDAVAFSVAGVTAMCLPSLDGMDPEDVSLDGFDTDGTESTTEMNPDGTSSVGFDAVALGPDEMCLDGMEPDGNTPVAVLDPVGMDAAPGRV
jgi:hypothetical protein